MSAYDRFVLERSERRLNHALFFATELTFAISFLWVHLCYYIFYFQQMDIYSGTTGKGESLLASLLWIPFAVICWHPNTGAFELKKEDWRLVPKRCGWMILFLAASAFFLGANLPMGRIHEKAVLHVYWKTYFFGLITLLVIERTALWCIFKRKVYPTVPSELCGGRSRRIRILLLLIAFVPLIQTVILLIGFQVNIGIPNFVYG